MTPTLAQRRRVHATFAARLRRFADENAERGLDWFAELDLAEAERQQALANAFTLVMREEALNGATGSLSDRRAAA
jgi:hypothetical protein